jgi:hypothetical protein
MSRISLSFFVLCMTAPTIAFAQELITPPAAVRTISTPDTQVTTAAPRAPQAPGPSAPATLATPRRPRGRDLNVQLEVTIGDQAGGAPEKRVVSMHIADGAFGRIRSNAGVGAALLNIDARVEILENDRIVAELTIEYRPAPLEGTQPVKRLAELNEMLTVILQNGKPLLISQAADPQNDRKMTVEVRASVAR